MNSNQYDELFSCVASGDAKAFSQVHTMYKSRLLYFAKRLVGDWNEAEDIVADAFLALWQHRQQITSDAHLRNFLFFAVRNKATDLNAQRERRMQLLAEMPVGKTFEEDLYDLKMIEEQMLHQLRQAVATLPKECGRIFELSWQAERSPAEIGRILDMNSATVRSQKRRAVQLIRVWIQKNKLKTLFLLSIFFPISCFFKNFL
jgi:RNA polymerase sigma-70 factor (ECF subfamily)